MALESQRSHELHFIKDEDGHESWHLAKDKAEAVNAHLTHWSKDSISNDAQHLSLIRMRTYCKAEKCLASVGLKKSQIESIEDKLLP